MKLSEKTDSYNNNFDFIRFFAAFSVLVWHCFALFGTKMPVILGTFFIDGVLVFFIISGFLITKSWMGKPDPLDFLKKRILRIFPAFICVILLSVFILGPLLTTLSLSDYFSNHLTWVYLRNILMVKITYILPGVFASNPYPHAVNGSLWTLPLEFFMYIVILIIGVLMLFKRKFLYPAIFIIGYFLITFYYVGSHANDAFFYVSGYHLARLGLAFLIASSFYVYRENIPLKFPIFLTAMAFYIMGLLSGYTVFMNLLTLPYIIIYIAYAPIPHLSKFGKYGDFSYGFYIYAFPIQQTITFLFKSYLNFYSYLLITFILTLIAAVISYHLIEKPALKLKKVRFRKNIKEYLEKYSDRNKFSEI